MSDPAVKTALVLTAMAVEYDAIRRRKQFQDWYFGRFVDGAVCRHDSEGVRLVLARTGVGIASAASAVSEIASRSELDAVFLLGVGGALSMELRLGDIVVSEAVIQHDAVFFGGDGDALMRPGSLWLSLPPEARPAPALRSDPGLGVMFAAELRKRVSHEVHVGLVASGSSFAGRLDSKELIVKRCPRALLVDMEAAGAALACERLGISFLTVKTVADRMHPQESVEIDYRAFLAEACENSARCIDVIQALMLNGRAGAVGEPC